MKKMEVDVEKQQVRVQAGKKSQPKILFNLLGTKLGALDAELERYGFVVPAGHNPDTGIAGLTLGGGVGHAVRLFGLTIDSLLQLRFLPLFLSSLNLQGL